MSKITQKPTVSSNSLNYLDKKDIKRAVSNKIESLENLSGTLNNLKISKNSKSLTDLTYIKNETYACSTVHTHTSTNIVTTESEKFKSNSLDSIKNILREENKAERYVTASEEEMTYANVPTIYNPDNSRQNNIIIVRSDYARQPPPSYQYYQRPQRFSYQGIPGQTPYYQTPNVVHRMSQDPSQIPPYRRGDTGNLFDTREIRKKFIRKVYLILATQILFTFGFITFCIYEKNTKEFLRRQWLLVIPAIITLLFVMIVLFCYVRARRTYPINFILLFLMTICMAYVMATVSCYYETKIVMISMGATGGICTLICILAWQDWFDITRYGMMILISLSIILSYGIFATIIALITGSNILYLIFACLITVLLCVYLMYGTQQILGGRRIEISLEDYILGAISLYVNIIIILYYILILGTHCR